MDKATLDCIREFIVEDVMRNAKLVYSIAVRGEEGISPDLLSIIASLYNYLHKAVTGEDYNYMFHWANKVGGWVEDDYFHVGSENKEV